MARLPVGRQVCVECGAGQGEIAGFLSSDFETVLATDIRPAGRAGAGGRATVLAAPAEALPVAGRSVDLLISMQALHHFDVCAHLGEARRVLRPGGVFAALAWGAMALPAALAGAYAPTLASVRPCWEDARDWVVSGYPGLAFPGARISLPRAARTCHWTLDELDAHIAGWSATQTALRRGLPIADPVTDGLNRTLRHAVSFPVVGQIFRVYS